MDDSVKLTLAPAGDNDNSVTGTVFRATRTGSGVNRTGRKPFLRRGGGANRVLVRKYGP
jgi:hypothetical protein